VTRALEAGAGIIFAKPCQWTSVVTYLDAWPSPRHRRPATLRCSDRRRSAIGPRSNPVLKARRQDKGPIPGPDDIA